MKTVYINLTIAFINREDLRREGDISDTFVDAQAQWSGPVSSVSE